MLRAKHEPYHLEDDTVTGSPEQEPHTPTVSASKQVMEAPVLSRPNKLVFLVEPTTDCWRGDNDLLD